MMLLLCGACAKGGDVVDGGPNFDGGSPQDVPVRPDVQPDVSCTTPEVACGVLCVNTETNPSNCGGCGRTCVLPNAEASCVAGACAVGACTAGFSDPNGNPLDGCEMTGEACTPGGPCTTACGSTGTLACSGGTESCMMPAETCNLVDDDCDGACDNAGCRIGVHRSSGNGGHFYTTDLPESMSAGYNLERANFYALARAAAPGTAPFHRCLKPNGLRFYTQSATCEGGGTLESVLGHIATSETCGGVPLFRLTNGGNHFYTTSAPERDNAANNLGYRFERVAGYVWSL